MIATVYKIEGADVKAIIIPLSTGLTIDDALKVLELDKDMIHVTIKERI